MWAMTCAHKKLPFNTILKVTNLANGKNVQVRVNDRGPFVADREIDLSKGAASKLGMIGSGTAKVRLEIVSLGAYTKESIQTAKKACQMAGIPFTVVSVKKGQASSQSDNQTVGSGSVVAKIEQIKSVKREQGKLWDIQVGAFSMKENALVFARKVKKAGFENVVLQNTSTVVRVVLPTACLRSRTDWYLWIIKPTGFQISRNYLTDIKIKWHFTAMQCLKLLISLLKRRFCIPFIFKKYVFTIFYKKHLHF